jgi:hypothetical protein
MKGRILIVITLVIVLSFAGVGYSAWTQGLSINSIFATGKIEVVFQDSVIVSNEECEITADADENVLNIYGTVAPDTMVQIEYDIYNGSSIPVKYLPDDETLPEGITLDQNDTVIEPGDYLEGNQLIILEPGENELILPFVQYNSSDNGGWKEELKICWNITVVEETVDSELDMINMNALTVEESTGEEATEDVPETEPPMTETAPVVDPAPDTDPNDPASGSDPAAETPAAESPSEDPADNVNLNDETTPSETPTERNDDNLAEDNTE